MKRPLLLLVGAATLSGCLGPRLTPIAAGCYAIQLDSLAPAYGGDGVPPMPELIVLDTTNGGQAQVPRRWLMQQGVGMRRVNVAQTRGNWGVVDERVVLNGEGPTALPADSISLWVSAQNANLQAVLGVASPEEWRGWAWLGPQYSREDPQLLIMRLRRSSCGNVPMALPR